MQMRKKSFWLFLVYPHSLNPNVKHYRVEVGYEDGVLRKYGSNGMVVVWN